jgi:polysaccharide pyruvyl transferase WcaK-like protein
MAPARQPGQVPRIALFGLFGVGNIGNEASLSSAIQSIRRRDRDAEIVVVCAGPNVVSAEHGVEAVSIAMAGPLGDLNVGSRWSRRIRKLVAEPVRWVTAFRFALGVDAIVVPGTGILDDFGTRPHEMPYELFRWSTVARLAHRPWIMVGVGAGPIEHPVSRRLMRRAVRNARFVTYRDESSAAFMRSIGQPVPPENLQPDVAWALTRPKGQQAPTSRSATGPHVGLGLMSFYGWSNEPSRGDEDVFERYMAAMVETARQLLDRGVTVRVLIGEASDRRVVDEFVRRIERELRRPIDRDVMVAPIDDFDQLLLQVGQVDAVIATRYHNVIAALMMERPTVAIGYSDKFGDVMRSCGLSEFCHDARAIDPTSIVADLDAVLDRSAGIAATLHDLNLRFHDEVELRFDTVLDGLLGSKARTTEMPRASTAPTSAVARPDGSRGEL